MNNKVNVGCVIPFGVGNILAALLGYSYHGSVGWTIVDFLFGWLYVLFYFLRWLF